MILLHDIETAITERLQSAGHTVTAAEVDEGFEKPTFFVNIFQNSAAAENPFMELVNVGVELTYHHDKPTRETLVKAADELTVLLTRTALKVDDRYLSVFEVTFDTENDVLYAYFELEFMRETSRLVQEYEKMQNIEIKVQIGVKANGTTPNTD